MIKTDALKLIDRAASADRIIVATTRVEGAVLLTRDKKINQYGKLGHVPTVDNLSRLD